MKSNVKQDFLNEAVRIGNELLTIADKDETGMSWKFMGMDKNMEITAYKSENISSGVSGIALFFLELYKQTQNRIYLNAAVNGMRWVEHYCRQNPSGFFSFFNGRMGPVYAFVKIYEATKESQYLDKALEITKNCTDFFKDYRLGNSLVNGTAGTILGLLHLHAAVGNDETWILKKIDDFVRHLIESSHPGPEGVYWGRSFESISGLCGFSNGSAGIGFVFLELGHYFKNEAFYWMAEQAFLYESCFYDNQRKNWLDLRKGINKYEDYSRYEEAFINGDRDFFTRGRDTNTWGHGAAGIGLSRLRAVEILGKNRWEKDLQKALEKTVDTDIDSSHEKPLFTYWSGACGRAELFLESYRGFGKSQYLKWAETIALKALDYYKTHQGYLTEFRYSGKDGDTSLFKGTPGIGYYYLKLCEPLSVPSILMPKLDKLMERDINPQQYPYLTISRGDIKKVVLKRLFKRSMVMVDAAVPQQLDKYLEGPEQDQTAPIKKAFVEFMEGNISTLPGKKKEVVSDIFSLELEKKTMDEAHDSNILLYIKERVFSRVVEEKSYRVMPVERFLNLKLALDKDITIKTTRWNWALHSKQREWSDNLNREAAEYPVLLKPSPEGIKEIPLSALSYTILNSFQQEQWKGSVKLVIHQLLTSFDFPGKDVKPLEEMIVKQIKEALISGILRETGFCRKKGYEL